MIYSCDVGSLPFLDDTKKFLEGAEKYGHVGDDSTKFFEERIIGSLLEKFKTGIEVPNYPQFRDMTQMFLSMIEGVERVSGGFVETGALTVKNGKGALPEVTAIKNNSQMLYERLGTPFNLRVCVTGPYTLSSLFAFKDKSTFIRLGRVLSEIVEDNVFSNKQGQVRLVAVDEPILGFVDDPLLDRGSETRENLLKAWESITEKIVSKGAQSCLHLHNTSDELFWEVKTLNVVESHTNDSFYQSKRTRERLESTDKFLKASVCTTDFDQLIRENIIATSGQKLSETQINEKIAETWRNLTLNKIDPTVFIESTELMKKRLVKTVEFFGENRILYAGPECGLRSFPTYESAIECLRRVSQTVKSTSK